MSNKKTEPSLDESLEGYARIVEDQAAQIEQQRQVIEKQNAAITTQDAQIAALREALTEQVEETVLAKAEIKMLQSRLSSAMTRIEELQDQMVEQEMDDFSKDA